MEEARSNIRNGHRLFYLLILTIAGGGLWVWLTTIRSFDEWWPYITLGWLMETIFNYGYWIPKLKAEGRLIVKK